MAETKSKEHYDLMKQFEKNYTGERLDHEPRELWGKGIIYQDGDVNRLFKAFETGYAFARSLACIDALL